MLQMNMATSSESRSQPETAPAIEIEIFGETVADARCLLKQAKEVIVHYPISSAYSAGTGLLLLSKQAFEKSILHAADGETMPCQLRRVGGVGGELTLIIGSYGARLAMDRARSGA